MTKNVAGKKEKAKEPIKKKSTSSISKSKPIDAKKSTFKVEKKKAILSKELTSKSKIEKKTAQKSAATKADKTTAKNKINTTSKALSNKIKAKEVIKKEIQKSTSKTIADKTKKSNPISKKTTLKKVIKQIEVPKKEKNIKPIPEKIVKEKLVSEKKISSKSSKHPVIEAKPLPVITNPDKLKPVKSILISQPKPELGKSPYIDLATEYKIKLDWRPFTTVESVSATDFRKQKIYLEQYKYVIFTSKIAIEQYFRICEEMRVKIKEDNKYFCLSETIALYLQKYIQYRKRKVFFGDGKLPKLVELILKHKEDGKYLLPCSNVKDKLLIDALNKNDIPFNEAIIYNTVASNLSDLSHVKYDMLVFFNPSAIDSLYSNFPDFKQEETRLAIFGNTTAEGVINHNLNINVFAPTPENPSLVDAIKKYITSANKK